MSETAHTPLPWKIDPRARTHVVGLDERGICSTGGHFSNSVDMCALDAENAGNADLIVTAVNHHAELVEALKEMREACAAACRVIATHGDEAIREFRAEAAAAGVANGFGKRAGDLLARIKEGDQ